MWDWPRWPGKSYKSPFAMRRKFHRINFLYKTPAQTPQPPPCPQLQLCSPVLKDPEEYCLCHPAVWGRRIREVLIPIVRESGGGVGGCKMIQPATLIPPYHFRLHIKPPLPPRAPTKQRSCALDPNVQILKRKMEQRKSGNNRAE